MTAGIDIESLRGWIGRTEQQSDVLTAFPVNAFAATLNRAIAPAVLPPLWHWLYFKPVVAQAQIDADGHPKRGTFLPPVPLPRRMWAGSRVHFRSALVVGAPVTRESRINDVILKRGRQGEFVLLSVQHLLRTGDVTAIEEHQDIVYRHAPSAQAPAPAERGTAAPADGMCEVWQPDPVQLFRYSALTFNAHRIHYDLPYAEQVEGYPGLVVQGPLTATMLLERFASKLEGQLAFFEFRALTPLIAGQPVSLWCRPVEAGALDLWAVAPDGRVCMRATARSAIA